MEKVNFQRSQAVVGELNVRKDAHCSKRPRKLQKSKIGDSAPIGKDRDDHKPHANYCKQFQNAPWVLVVSSLGQRLTVTHPHQKHHLALKKGKEGAFEGCLYPIRPIQPSRTAENVAVENDQR